tara:strand:- start:12650 stop:13591 length:942 start_codon:yes stop_codon:yes gene_type:complete
MEINLLDLADNFGCDHREFSNTFREFYETLDLSYETLSESERDQVLLEILHKLENDTQIIGHPDRTQVWYEGWKENLDDFLKNKAIEEIVPKFIRPNKIVRYNGNFIKPSNPYFERDFAKLIQIYCYHQFIKNYSVENVYEFGCGSSFNLMTMANLREEGDSEIDFYGSDFVQSSVDLCNELGKHYKINLKGFRFDMIKPDRRRKIKKNSAVFTFGAIEQLRSQFKDFILYLLENRPKVCFHIEPTMENYDPDNLFDYLQIKFHKKRGYTQGLLPYLQQLEEEGKLVIVKEKRLNFGSKFMEGYHLYVWEMEW